MRLAAAEKDLWPIISGNNRPITDYLKKSDQWTNPTLIKILNSTSLDKIFITA
jgi:hypothetical protein